MTNKIDTSETQPDPRITQALDLLDLTFEALALGQDVHELLVGIKKQLEALSGNPQDNN